VASIVAIADGLEARCATIEGLTASSEWVDNPITPGVIALPAERDFIVPTTFAGRYSVFFRLLVIVSESAGVGAGFRALYDYLDPSGDTSIIAALEGDRTLGGIAEDTNLGAVVWRTVGFHDVGGARYIGGFLDNIEIYVNG